MGLFRKVLYMNPLTGPSILFYDVVTGQFQEEIDETKDEILDTIGDGLESLEDTLAGVVGGIASAISGFGSDIGSGLLDLIRSAGIAVIESVSDVYDYTADKVGDKKVQLVSSLTVLIIAGFTASYILARLPGRDAQ